MTNSERIEWAETALTEYFDADCDSEAALCDLLADLMHWARSMDIDFESRLQMARYYFQEDIKPIGEGDNME